MMNSIETYDEFDYSPTSPSIAPNFMEIQI